MKRDLLELVCLDPQLNEYRGYDLYLRYTSTVNFHHLRRLRDNVHDKVYLTGVGRLLGRFGASV